MKQYIGAKKLAILAVLTMTLLAGCASLGPTMLSDEAVFDIGATPPVTAIYCGRNRPYILHIRATAGGSAGTFRITFMDRDSMGFEVPAGTMNVTTHALGGVQGVDTTVKITAEGGIQRMMARVEAMYWDTDPFDETLDGAPPHSYNFCVAAPSEPGSTSAARIIP